MTRSQLLPFLMITIGCLFCFIGIGLMQQTTLHDFIGACVGAGGLALALWNAATYVIRSLQAQP